MLRKNLVANYLGQGWSALMGIAFVPWYIHYLGIEAYGLIGLFALLQTWLTLLDMGMTPTISREMARFTGGSCDSQTIRDLLRSVEIVALTVSLFSAVAIHLAAKWLSTNWLRTDELPVEIVANAFSIMGCVASIRFIENIYRSSLVGLQMQVTLNVVTSLLATIRGLGAVVILALVSRSIDIFFYWQLIVSLITVLVLAISTYCSLPVCKKSGRFRIRTLRSIWSFAGGMLGIAFLSLMLTHTDKLILSRILSLSEYGYYSLSVALSATLFTLAVPITQAWFPRLSQLHESNNELEFANLFHQGSQLITIVVGTAGIILVCFSDTVLDLWTNDQSISKNSAVLVSILAVGNLLNCLIWVPYQAQLATGWTGFAIFTNIVAVILMLPAILLITPKYGSLGAATIWLCLNLGYLFVCIPWMFRRILKKEMWKWYIDDLFIPLTCASLVALAARALFNSALDRWLQIVFLLITTLFTIAASCISSNYIRSLLVRFVANASKNWQALRNGTS